MSWKIFQTKEDWLNGEEFEYDYADEKFLVEDGMVNGGVVAHWIT